MDDTIQTSDAEEQKLKCSEGKQVHHDWITAITSPEKPTHWSATAQDNPALANLDLWPGQIVLIGGMPGAGKSSLALQILFDTLANHDDLSALVFSCEMHPFQMLNRQLARLSGEPLDDIQNGNIIERWEQRCLAANEILRPIAHRITWGDYPFTFRHVAAACLHHKPDILLIDYLQRFTLDGHDRRGAIDAAMNSLRPIAMAGACVIIVSSTSRQKSKQGNSTYDVQPDLACFKESGDIEYGCDDAYVLQSSRDQSSEHNNATLHHLKSRYGHRKSISLLFHRATQLFEAAHNGVITPADEWWE